MSAGLWQSLPEEIRYQVLTLLARLIAKGALADPDSAVAEVRRCVTPLQPGVSAPALLLTTDKITVSHRSRDAYVYVRQSTPTQMVQHTESLARQYELRERAVALGWPRTRWW